MVSLFYLNHSSFTGHWDFQAEEAIKVFVHTTLSTVINIFFAENARKNLCDLHWKHLARTNIKKCSGFEKKNRGILLAHCFTKGGSVWDLNSLNVSAWFY